MYKIVLSLTLGLFLIAGCETKEQFYEDVSLSREMAYKQWENRRQQQKQNQTVISGKLNMQDCLKLAVDNNKMLQSLVEEKEIARGVELKSYSAILPSAGVTAGYMRKDKPMSINTGAGTITLGDRDNYSAGLRVTQPLFAGGSIIAGLNTGKLYALLADQTVRAGLETVIFEAARQYYDVLLSQHLYDNSAEAVRSAQAQLDDVKKKRQSGIASDFDVLRSEVELSNFKAEMIQHKNAINVSKANLLKTMGVSQDSDVVLSDELVYVPLTMRMEQAVEVAYRNRPDLFSHQFNIKMQKELLTIARSRYFPTIGGYYDYLWSNPDPHDNTKIEWGNAWDIGIMASLPLFDGFSREGDVIQQKARLKQSQIDLVDAEETALFELTKALFTIENAAEFVDSQNLNLTRAKEGLRLAEIGYREGTNTQFETIDAQAALTKARAFYYQAIYTHNVAKLMLQKAMGTLTTYEPVIAQNKADPNSGNRK